MLELIIIILVLLWLFGYFGRVRFPALNSNLVHLLLVIAVILIIVKLL